MTLIKCNLPSCSKEFAPRKGKIYCSNTCRSKASIIKTSGLGNLVQTEIKKEDASTPKASPAIDHSVMNQMPAHAQFIIRQLEKESDRWEKAYNEQKKKRSDLIEQLTKIQTELAELKTEQKINSIEQEHKKPGALQGILDSPLGQHIGPALGKLAERFVDSIPMEAAPAAIAQIAGTGPVGEELTQINNYYTSQPRETQEVIYAMLNTAAGLQPDEAKVKFQYIKNLLNYGTTATGTHN